MLSPRAFNLPSLLVDGDGGFHTVTGHLSVFKELSLGGCSFSVELIPYVFTTLAVGPGRPEPTVSCNPQPPTASTIRVKFS